VISSNRKEKQKELYIFFGPFSLYIVNQRERNRNNEGEREKKSRKENVDAMIIA
jgi:hypothetical protein